MQDNLTIENKTTLLNGLVLAGGRSKRMGRDKSSIEWYGKEQKYHLVDLLNSSCSEVYISQRQDQQLEESTYNLLIDTFSGIGPYGGILSAFHFNPGVAWLVVACDLPLLDLQTIQFLLSNRNPGAIATTFQSPFDGLPEPLITIWEPKSHEVLLSYLNSGYTCPRKVLIKNIVDVQLLQPPNPEAMMNVNSPQDFDEAQQIIRKHQEPNYEK